MLRKHTILLDPVATVETAGAGPTVVTTEGGPKGGTTQEPPPERQPTAKDLEQEFNIDDFNPEQLPEQSPEPVVDENKTKAAPKKKVEQKPVQQPKVAEPKEQGTEQEGEGEKPADGRTGLAKFLKPPIEGKKVGIPPTNQVKVSTGTRDYSGLSQEEVSVLKQMSNPAYEYTRKLIHDNKDLAKLKDSTYLQHESAYLLDPQYQKLREDVFFGKREADCWKEQLIAMAEGKNWKPLQDFDKNGNPVFGPERPPTAKDAEEVRRVLSQVDNFIAQKASTLEQYPSTYKSRVSEDMRAIDTECKQRFEWESNPQLLDHCLPIQYPDGVKDVPLKQIREEFTSLFPPYMRSHPATRVAANLFIALRVGEMQMAQATGTQQVQETIQDEEHRVEPTSKQKIVGAGKKKEEVFDLSGLEDM